MTEQMVIHASAVTVSARPEVHVENIVKASGTSFYWAMRRLPPAKRAAMYAIYAFCREVDDIADDIGGPGAEAEKRKKLDQWRDEIGRLFAGDTQTVSATGVWISSQGNYQLRDAYAHLAEPADNDRETA